MLASTPVGTGGNITLQIADDISLQNNSTISAQALQDANGGNITIDAEFIIASLNQNNDIIANAEQGAGGSINITAEGVFGIQERPLNPFTNDINASSDFGISGTVSINTPDTGALQEAIETPEIVETETLGANACSGGGTKGASSFEIVGQGGVPPEPTEPFTADAIVIEGKSSPIGRGQSERLQSEETEEEVKTFRLADVVPARGMIIKENGDVILTAYPTPNVVQRTPQSSDNCRDS